MTIIELIKRLEEIVTEYGGGVYIETRSSTGELCGAHDVDVTVDCCGHTVARIEP